jgi:hypothetical protein
MRSWFPILALVWLTVPGWGMEPSGPVQMDRLPLPGSSRQYRARQEIEGQLRGSQSLAATDKLTLARKLMEETQTAGIEPNARYVRLQSARDLAIQANDPAMAFQAIDDCAATFLVEPTDEKLRALSKMEKSNHGAEIDHLIANSYPALITEATSAGKYEAALRLCAAGEKISRRIKDEALLARILELKQKPQAEWSMLQGVDWAKGWTYEGEYAKHPVAQLDFSGRKGVWHTHPPGENSAFKWRRTAWLDLNRKYSLYMDVAAEGGHPLRDWLLIVKVDGEELHNEAIDSPFWKTIKVDLSRFSGRMVTFELWNSTGGMWPWLGEHAYWDQVRIVPEP